MSEFALTTVDNPFDPFKQFDQWNLYDEEKKYFTCAYLARVANTSPYLSDDDNDSEIKDAMEEICFYNPLLYRIVFSDDNNTYPLKQ